MKLALVPSDALASRRRSAEDTPQERRQPAGVSEQSLGEQQAAGISQRAGKHPRAHISRTRTPLFLRSSGQQETSVNAYPTGSQGLRSWASSLSSTWLLASAQNTHTQVQVGGSDRALERLSLWRPRAEKKSSLVVCSSAFFPRGLETFDKALPHARSNAVRCLRGLRPLTRAPTRKSDHARSAVHKHGSSVLRRSSAPKKRKAATSAAAAIAVVERRRREPRKQRK